MAKGDSQQKPIGQMAPISSTPSYNSTMVPVGSPPPDLSQIYTGGNKIDNGGFVPRPSNGFQLDNGMMGPGDIPPMSDRMGGPLNANSGQDASPIMPPTGMANPWLIQAIQNSQNIPQPINANSNSATPQRIYQGDATARTRPSIMPNMNMFQNWVNKMGLQADPNKPIIR